MKKYIFLFLLLMITGCPLWAQENVMESTSQVYNFDLGFSGVEDLDLGVDMEAIASMGRDYALVIAVSDYDDNNIKDLDQPISDATELVNTLQRLYTFEDDYTTFLKNATKSQILIALDDLAKKITPKDNLLIFYAGHGDWDEKLEIGYWLPSDSNKKDRSTWFPNSTLRDYIKGIRSRHTLLIADACFSGGIFKTRGLAEASTAIEKLYEIPSRKAMTSGNLKEVPDKSVFIEYMVKTLKRNRDPYLPAGDLFYQFKNSVIDNSANGQVPLFGEIQGTGDEGGDFIFKRKI